MPLITATTPGASRWDRLVIEAKARIIRDALARSGGNRTRAAEALGLERTYLVRLIRLYVPEAHHQQGTGRPKVAVLR